MVSAGLYFCSLQDSRSPEQRIQQAVSNFAPDLTDPDLTVARTAKGKPFFPHLPLHLSISHSGDFWLIALSTVPIGVDLQDTRPARYEALARRFFHPEEIDYLARHAFQDFYQVWTAKESYVKLTGDGINSHFSQFSVYSLPFYFCEIPFAPGYALTLCSEQILKPFLKRLP